MLRTTCFSSRWWGLFLFLFLPWLVEMTLGPPNRLIWTGGRGEYRWWRTEMRRERWATESDSKKGLIEAWGCWTEPWITNGCLHSLLPACRNESQPPPHQPGHSRLLARLSKKKGKKTPLSSERGRDRGRKRERERGRDNEARRRRMRRMRGRCVWNTRARSWRIHQAKLTRDVFLISSLRRMDSDTCPS